VKKQINEIKRMQLLAGVLNEAKVDPKYIQAIENAVASLTIVKRLAIDNVALDAIDSALNVLGGIVDSEGNLMEGEPGVNIISNPIPNVIGDSGDFRVKLRIGDKYVLSAKASDIPSDGELNKTLKYIEKQFGNKYDLENAELVVLDPKGKQVASVKKQGATGGSGGRPDGAFKIQLKIDGEPVMTTTADGNPSPEELSNTLVALETKYRNKFDFEKAEIVVLDPKGEQVGSITKRDNFLRTKATYVGDTYSTTHGTV